MTPANGGSRFDLYLVLISIISVICSKFNCFLGSTLPAPIPHYYQMRLAQLNNHVGKAFALMAAVLVLPVLAYAGHEKASPVEIVKVPSRPYLPVTTVPEANTGVVLIPFVGAMLLFGSVQLFRARRARA
jgi:hypothetical protein